MLDCLNRKTKSKLAIVKNYRATVYSIRLAYSTAEGGSTQNAGGQELYLWQVADFSWLQNMPVLQIRFHSGWVAFGRNTGLQISCQQIMAWKNSARQLGVNC